MAKVRTSYKGDRVGLFAMDPGGTTGLAWGTPVLDGSVKEIFERDPLTVDEVDCYDEMEGAIVIAETFGLAMFHWQVEKQIPLSHIFFIYEDFVIRAGGKFNVDRTLLSPVRISHLVMGMLVKIPVNWVAQQPSDAKSRYTNDRLRTAGLWTPKLEHGRDATRHAALWALRALQ